MPKPWPDEIYLAKDRDEQSFQETIVVADPDLTYLDHRRYVNADLANVLSPEEAIELVELADFAEANRIGLTAEQRLVLGRLRDYAGKEQQ